jgi:hypothetical protein
MAGVEVRDFGSPDGDGRSASSRSSEARGVRRAISARRVRKLSRGGLNGLFCRQDRICEPYASAVGCHPLREVPSL